MRIAVFAGVFAVVFGFLGSVTAQEDGPAQESSEDRVVEPGEDETGLQEPEEPGTGELIELTDDQVVDAPNTGLGPRISLPDEVDDPGTSPTTPTATPADQPDPGSAIDPLRGMQEARFARAVKTSIGGYGEMHFNLFTPEGGGDVDTQLDMHRLVLFVAHNFSERFRFYTELEVEHAFVVGGDDRGQLGIEQAFVDWRILDSNALNLRFGIVLIPMGIVNQWHEPPIFNGVERPRVDNRVIPTTWREGGLGIWGEPVEGFRYEFYLVGGLDASGFSGSSGLRGGRQNVAQATANGPALTARVEYEPILGMVAGVAGYVGWAGANTDAVDARVTVGGVAADWRVKRKGFEARAVAAYFHVGDTDALRAPADPTDPLSDPISDIGSDILGVYGELGYNLLHVVDTEHELVPFVRVEYYDTTLGESDDAFNLPAVIEPVFGLSYRPIPQFVIKADYVLRRPSTGNGVNIFNAGVGWMF